MPAEALIGAYLLYTASLSVDKAVQNLAALVSLHGGVVDAALEATNYRGVADGTGLDGTKRAEAGIIFPWLQDGTLILKAAKIEGDGWPVGRAGGLADDQGRGCHQDRPRHHHSHVRGGR